MVELAHTNEEIAACFGAMKQLRTDLAEHEFVGQVRKLMEQGYQLAFLRQAAQVVCVAGFKIANNLALGKHLYVEDLSTREEARSSGYGAEMMTWLRDFARREGCAAIHLDSGVQRHRAHKFYLNRNMNIVSHHFLERLV